MSVRNSKGQFVVTSGSTRYRKVQYKGSIMGENCKVMCQAIGIDKIPSGFVVHHVNGNKKDNSIGNLALMNHKAHNVIHCTGRTPWNKGLSRYTSKKWDLAIKKRMIASKKTFKIKFTGTWNLYLQGLTAMEIAKIEGISSRQVYDRLLHVVS